MDVFSRFQSILKLTLS